MTFEKTNLDISIKVWNQGEQKWEEPALKPGEKEQIIGALDVIKKNGEINSALMKEGSVLEVTGKRVLLKEGQETRDLTPDTGVLTRDPNRLIRTKLTKVAGIVKELSGKAIEKVDAEIQIDSKKAQKEGGVVIEVRVVAAGERLVDRFEEDLKGEKAHLAVVEEANQLLNNEEWSQYLKEEFGKERFNSMKEKLQAVTVAQAEITEIMTNVEDQLQWGDPADVEKAVKHYVAHMSTAYGRYCDALMDWAPERNLLIEHLGTEYEKNPFLFGQRIEREEGATIIYRQPHSQLSIAKTLFAYADKIIPDKVETGEALGSIEHYTTNLENTKPFAEFCNKEIEGLIIQEADFSYKVIKCIEELSKEEVQSNLGQKGFSQEEIKGHIEKLNVLSEVAEGINADLTAAQRYFELGNVKEGLKIYQDAMVERSERYQQALSDLIIPQRVAANRLRDFAPFQLNLSRLGIHEKSFSAMSKKEEELGLLNTEGGALYNLASPIEQIFAQNTVYQNAATFPQLSNDLNDWQMRGEAFLTNMGVFIEAFQTRRRDLEVFMNKEGFTDLETALIFNHYVETYRAFQDFYHSLQAATDLANRKDSSGALNKLSELINEKFPRINQAIAAGIPAQERFQDTRVKMALFRFLGPESKKPVSLDVGSLMNLFPQEVEKLKSAINQIEGFETPETFTQAVDLVANGAAANNTEKARQTRLYQQDFRLFNFFNFSNIQDDQTYGPVWKQILKQEKWSAKEAEAFTKVYQAYGALIQKLQEGERAVEREADPIKKRELRGQLNQLAVKLQPEIGKLADQFKKLGGNERLESLSRAASALIQRSERADQIRGKIEEEYGKIKAAYDLLKRPFPFESVDGLINGLESLFRVERSPQDQIAFELAWGEALSLVQQLKRANLFQEIKNEAAELQKLPLDRRAYLREFGVRHHFYIPWEDKIVERTLLTGPQTNDENYKRIIGEAGWNPQKIQKLSNWYDAYNKAVHPIELAQARLAEDPENSILQNEFNEIYSQQIGKINKLAEQMNKDADIGGIKGIKKLEWGVMKYTQRLTKMHENAKKSLELAVGEENKQIYRNRLSELKATMDRLKNIKFSPTIEKGNRILSDVSNTMKQKMSWQKGFLNSLRDSKSPLAKELKGNLPEGLTVKDIGAIETLFGDYQNELLKMNELERKFGIDPHNNRLRDSLRKELSDQAVALEKLDGRRGKLGEKIDKLQGAIDSIKVKMENGLQKVKAAEEVDRVVETNSADLERTRSLGGRTDEEAKALIAQCDRLNVKKAFADKIEFKRSVYRRHVRVQ